MTIPRLPRLLGVGGLIPPLVCAVLLHWGTDSWRAAAQAGAVIWAALALTFLGGSWWGLAAGAPAAERRNTLGWLWVASALAVAVAFAALMPWALGRLPAEPALMALGGALMMSAGVDARLGPLAPRWWLALRLPVAVGTGLASFAAALA